MKNRLRPGPWIAHAYPLRQCAATVDSVAGRLFGQRAGKQVVDVGWGATPYRPLFAAHAVQYLHCDGASENAAIDLIVARKKNTHGNL